MIRDVRLINHLPPFLRDYKELKAVTTVEDPEFQKVMDESERIKDNTFILTADVEGITRFEEILKIYSSEDESLETRRSRVLSRWNDVIPYTYFSLIDKLRTLQGNDSFVVNRKLNTHTIEITTQLELPGQIEELNRILDYMIPANLIIDSNNKIICKSEGNTFLAMGMAQALMFEISDQYDLNVEASGNLNIGVGQFIGRTVVTNDEQMDINNIQVITTEG